MDNSLYSYSPITERPPIVWPNEAKLAFYIGVNVEHYEVDKPSTSIFAGTSHLRRLRGNRPGRAWAHPVLLAASPADPMGCS